MHDLHDEFDKTTALILAEEKWAPDYNKDPETFAKLLKTEARMQRLLLSYLKDISDRADRFVDWGAYNLKLREIHADAVFDVDVIVTQIPDAENDTVMQFMYDPVEAVVDLGALAGEAIYQIPLGDSGITEAVSREARNLVGQLIGKKLDKDGQLIDNPKAKYRINDTTREYIKSAIRTSLDLGEDQAAATARIATKIKDPRRAEKIAATEAVNGYQGGLYQYAQQTGAVGKEWLSIPGACVICMNNVKAGIIGLTDTFPSGHLRPSAHPWDRCSVRYVYQEELNSGA